MAPPCTVTAASRSGVCPCRPCDAQLRDVIAGDKETYELNQPVKDVRLAAISANRAEARRAALLAYSACGDMDVALQTYRTVLEVMGREARALHAQPRSRAAELQIHVIPIGL